MSRLIPARLYLLHTEYVRSVLDRSWSSYTEIVFISLLEFIYAITKVYNHLVPVLAEPLWFL